VGDNKGHHFIADLQAGLGVFVDGLYNAGRIHTGNKRAGFIACASACTAHGVGRAHGSGLNTNQDFAWSGCWSWEFVNLENFWTPGASNAIAFIFTTAGQLVQIFLRKFAKSGRCQSCRFGTRGGNVMSPTLEEGSVMMQSKTPAETWRPKNPQD